MAKRDAVSVTGTRRPLGYLQISAAQLAAAITLPQAIAAWVAANPTSPLASLPAAEYFGYAIIQQNVTSAGVRWTDDGIVVPTTTVGMAIGANAELDYVGDFYKITFIVATGSPILDISLYD